MSEEKQYEEYIYEFLWDIQFIVLDKESSKTITFKPIRLPVIRKTCNYDRDFLPILYMETVIDEKYLPLLHNYQNSIIVNIKMTKLYYSNKVGANSSVNSEDADNLIKDEVISENNYICLFDKGGLPPLILDGESYINKPEEQEEKEKKQEEGSENAMKSNMTTIKCTLFEVDDRRLNKYIINDHIISAKVADAIGTAITLVASKDKRQMKIGQIIDPPDNQVQYKEIWLLPLNLANSLKMIQKIYGIYSHGLVTFLDNGLLYVLKKHVSDHEYADFQTPYTKINLYQKPGTLNYPFIVKVDTKEENAATYNANVKLNPQNKDMETSESVGDRMIVTNTDLISSAVSTKKGEAEQKGEGFLVLDKPSQGHMETGTKLILDYDELNNPYNTFEFFHGLSNHIVLTLDVKGCDPTDFAPNKKIVINIADDDEKNQKYQGDYCINSVTFNFSPKPGTTEFNTTCIALLVLNKSI